MATSQDTAALFMNGGSQAVRLPREYRFEGSAVRIRREGNAVILEPLAKPSWPEGYWERLAELGPPSDDLVPPPPLAPDRSRDEWLEGLDRDAGG